jgi:hypothetical protein
MNQFDSVQKMKLRKGRKSVLSPKMKMMVVWNPHIFHLTDIL